MNSIYPKGIKAKHAIITENCRRPQTHGGPMEAFDVAVQRLRDEYDAIVKARGEDGSNYHVMLILETPRHQEANRQDAGSNP